MVGRSKKLKKSHKIMSTNINYKEEVEKYQKAFKDLSNGFNAITNVVRDATSAMSKLSDFSFENHILSMNEKRFLNFVKIENNYGYMIDDFFNELMSVEAGNYCNDCDLKGTFCEGARCDEAIVYWYEKLPREQKRKTIISAFGKAYFYNLSLRLKLKLLNF